MSRLLPGRATRRRLALGLQTVLGLRRRGFFIPYRYADSLPAPGHRPPYIALERLFTAREPAFVELLAAIDGFASELEAIGDDPPPAPRWAQGWFPRLDAAAAYTLLRRLAPDRLIEIGSGHSTRFFARAIADGGLATRTTAIDPAPRADIVGLTAEMLPKTVQAAGLEPFERLGAGDLLSIDSSHILMPGSDVDLLLNVVLPGLPAGVVVHLHDIFLPDDYPRIWDWRGYNEQLAVAALIQGGGYEILWASRYVATRMAGALAGTVLARLPLREDAYEASLWLRKLV